MKTAGRIGYWLVALALIAAILVSLNYTWSQAILISLVFCPCAILLEWLMPKAVRPIQKVYVALAVLMLAILLLILLHCLLWSPFMKTEFWRMLEVQPVLVNPVFLGLVMAALALGDNAWSKWLERKLAAQPRNISFYSDRKTVTLDVQEIAFIESNDTEVRLVTRDGRSFRNKTRIGQWEAILGEGFVRIHRSYLVNRAYITSSSDDSLLAAGHTLPISRKYRNALS